MAISTNIDGSPAGGVNQLFDLIALVSDPQAYNDKVKALQEAIDRNQKLVDLAGPASDILILNERAKVANEEAQASIATAKAEAEKIILDAKTQAEQIRTDAKLEADSILVVARKTMSDADDELASAKKERATIAKDKSDLKKATAEAKKATDDADQAKADADQAKADAIATRQSILDKCKAFVESLA
jgi:cell division septum initiation protein DivIVA